MCRSLVRACVLVLGCAAVLLLPATLAAAEDTPLSPAEPSETEVRSADTSVASESSEEPREPAGSSPLEPTAAGAAAEGAPAASPAPVEQTIAAEPLTAPSAAAGTVVEYTTASSTSGPAVAPDGSVWFGEFLGDIGHIDRSGTLTEMGGGVGAAGPFAFTNDGVPVYAGTADLIGLVIGGTAAPSTASSSTNLPAAGPDGNVWFGEDAAARVGSVDSTGAVTEYVTGIPTRNVTPGPFGRMYYGGQGVSGVGFVAGDGTVTEHATAGFWGAGDGNPAFVQTADGSMWFAEFPASKIGRILPDGTLVEYDATASTSHPVLGGDGNVWFSVGDGTYARAGADGSLTYHPAGVDPGASTLGSDGSIWFASLSDSQIRRITPTGLVTAWPAGGQPVYLVLGLDGNVWFGNVNRAAIGRVTPDGVVTTWPTSAPPGYLVVAPDGKIWYAGIDIAPSGPGVVGYVVAAEADLSITKTLASPIPPRGGTLEFRLLVHNAGPTDAGAVVVTDMLPWQLAFVSISRPSDWTCVSPAVGRSGAIRCETGRLAAGATVGFVLVTRLLVSISRGTTFTNTASVASAAPDPDPSNNTDTVTISVPEGEGAEPVVASLPFTGFTPIAAWLGGMLLCAGLGLVRTRRQRLR